MSRAMKIIKLQMRMQRPAFRKGFDGKKLRQAQAASSQIPLVQGVAFEEKTIAGCIVDVATPDNMRDDAIIYYIHGGGFVSGDPRNFRSFTSYLAKESGWQVFGVVYRLAPEHPFPAAPEDCYGVYLALAEAYPDKKIYLVGESAGATLSIVTTLMARDRGVRIPDAVVAYAPGGDFSSTLKRPLSKKKDPVLNSNVLDELRNMYCPNDAMNPYVSPAFANFRDFPPLRIVWDADETLAEDGRVIARKAKNAGVYVEAKEWQDTFHTFEMMPTILPEAREEVNDSIAFLKNLRKEENFA